MSFLWALLLALAILWAVVSAAIAAFRPWRVFRGPDAWIAPVLILFWPAYAGWIAWELIRESRDPIDDDDADDEGEYRGG